MGKSGEQGHSHEALQEINLFGARQPGATAQPQRKRKAGVTTRPRHPVQGGRCRQVQLPELPIHRPSQPLHHHQFDSIQFQVSNPLNYIYSATAAPQSLANRERYQNLIFLKF